MTSKLTISAAFVLPDDALLSAKLQVSVLEAAEAFKAALAKLKAEHTYAAIVSNGDAPAPAATKVRKTRTPRAVAAEPAATVVDTGSGSEPAPAGKASPPWAKSA